MIADQMASKLRRAAKSVLEMKFMTPVSSDQEFPPPGVVDPILVGPAFGGRSKGTFALVVASATAQRGALNFIGLEPGKKLEHEAVVDLFGVLANMLCGPFVGQLNFRDTFRLSGPVKDCHRVRPDLPAKQFISIR